MTKSLKLADDLTLPLDVVTEKLAFLGRTGSGKTYAATKLAELLLEHGAQVVALDPVGVWPGLRIAGSGPACSSVYIFGGLHGDFPLAPAGGALMADVVVDRGISAILDVSQFVASEMNRFALDFATRFFQRKKASPSAVHLFLEECQEFIPQNPMREEARTLHAFERLWKLGRNFGIGGSCISQRPQEINKKALNQAGTLFVFQMTGPQERKAIESWVADKGLDDDIASVLPKLKVGQPHVWSPTFLGVSKTVRILPKRTADVSSTPKVGARSQERPLSPVDLEKLKADMAATVERARAEDPKELRKLLAAAERRVRELEARPAPQPTVERVDVPVLDLGTAAGLDAVVANLRNISADIERQLAEARVLVAKAAGAPAIGRSAPNRQVLQEQRKPAGGAGGAGQAARPARSANGHHDGGELNGPERRILDAIAWLEALGIEAPEQVAVAFLAGYTYGGGAFNNPRGRLNVRGLVEYVPGERIRLTDEGKSLASFPDAPLTAAELQERVLSRLPGPEQRVLRPLIASYPNPLSNDECARAAGYTPNAGAYNNPRGRLRSLGLVEYPTPGMVAARPLLFLES